MAMLADVVDAVIGCDTHRDTNHVEIAYPSGAVIATRSFSNDSAGHAEALAWMVAHAPGSRLVLSIEGTRSYGAGLARAAAAVGILVIEAEQPTRKHRRGKGKSDPIDAHLAVLHALGLDAAKLPTPRADGHREALRILLCARQELTTTSRPGRSTDSVLCCATGTTPTAAWPEHGCPTPPWPAWPGADCPARRADSRPCAMPRFVASRWRYARRDGR